MLEGQNDTENGKEAARRRRFAKSKGVQLSKACVSSMLKPRYVTSRLSVHSPSTLASEVQGASSQPQSLDFGGEMRDQGWYIVSLKSFLSSENAPTLRIRTYTQDTMV